MVVTPQEIAGLNEDQRFLARSLEVFIDNTLKEGECPNERGEYIVNIKVNKKELLATFPAKQRIVEDVIKKYERAGWTINGSFHLIPDSTQYHEYQFILKLREQNPATA